MKAGAAGKIYVVCDIRCTGGAFFKIIQKGLIHMKKINICFAIWYDKENKKAKKIRGVNVRTL